MVQVKSCAATGWDVLMVCRKFRTIHVCGEACQDTIETPGCEGLLCRLTHRTLKTRIMSSYTPIAKDTKRAKSQGGVIRMGTCGERKRQKSDTDVDTATRKRVRDKIKARLNLMMASKERVAVYDRQRARLFLETDKLLRGYRGYIPLMEVDQAIHREIAQRGPYLNEPPPLFPQVRLFAARPPSWWSPAPSSLHRTRSQKLCDLLTADLYAYLYTLQEATANNSRPIVATPRNADIFAACMCHHLAMGYSVGGNEVVPKIPYFAKHTPPQLCFAELGVVCGHMSEFNRSFKQACTGMHGSFRYGIELTLRQETLEQLTLASVLGQRRRKSSATCRS